MKRLFLCYRILLSVFALLAASCREEKIELPNDAENQISFNATVGRQSATRAKEFGYWQANQQLHVSAYKTGLSDTTPWKEFELTYVSPGSTAWTYSPVVEVPIFSLTYYSYYPMSSSVSNMTANGAGASFTYTVPNPQEDIVTAMTVTPHARVPLMFHHILSEVNFAVQGIQGVKIDVKNIYLANMANVGNYQFSPSGGQWTSLSGTATYSYQWGSDVALPTAGDNSNIVYLGNKGGNDPTDNDRPNALMLLPQTFTPAQGTGPYLAFNYQLKDMAGADLKGGEAVVYLGDFTTVKWEMGKRYLYLIDFTGLVEEGPITFEVIVFGWSDAMSKIAQPIIVADATKVLIEKAITTHNTNKATTPSLTVFPISLPEGKNLGAETLTLKDFDDSHFAKGDQIRIQVWIPENADNILLDPSIENTKWTRSVNGSIMTLSKI